MKEEKYQAVKERKPGYVEVNEGEQPFCWVATSTLLGGHHCASDSGALAFCKKTACT